MPSLYFFPVIVIFLVDGNIVRTGLRDVADSLTCDMKRAANSETDKSALFQKSIYLYEVVTLVVYKQG